MKLILLSSLSLVALNLSGETIVQPVPPVAPILLAQAAEPPADIPEPPPAPAAKPVPPAEPKTGASFYRKTAVRADSSSGDASNGGGNNAVFVSSGGGGGGGFGGGGGSQANFTYKLNGGPGREGHSLVIRSSDTDHKNIAAAEEDLSIMSRLLDKALKKKGDDEMVRAMGINLSSFGGGVRNLEIEGYGAIFMLQVNFPLSSPPAKVAEEKPAEQTNSAWEEAKREMYGTRVPMRVRGGGSAVPKVEFDPKRVDDLKDSLLETLKNAANIRDLKDNESVTLVVTTGDDAWGSAIKEFNFFVADGAGYSSSGEHPKANQPASKLVIRVKKSDIDAFSKGKLNSGEFRKKASIALY